MDEVTFVVTDATSAAAQWAMGQYFAELDRRFRDGFPVEDALAEAATAFSPPAGSFVLAERSGATVGCGAIHHVDGDTGEIKRMWISATARGMGLGKRLLAFLELQIASTGRTRVVLDTNASLIEAIAMYESVGYRRIERYNDNPHAELWFEKPLRTP